MKRWTVGGDVVLHAMLVGVRGLEARDEQLRKFVHSSVESVNVRDVQTMDGGGGTGRTGRHHVEVV